MQKRYDARHEKTDLTFFAVVTPKEGWAHMAAPILFWYDPDFLDFESYKDTLHYTRMGAATRAHASFGMTTTKTLRPVFL